MTTSKSEDNAAREWWLVPWSIGWECRTKKPEGESIHVIEKSAYDQLKATLNFNRQDAALAFALRERDQLQSENEKMSEHIKMQGEARSNCQWEYNKLADERDALKDDSRAHLLKINELQRENEHIQKQFEKETLISWQKSQERDGLRAHAEKMAWLLGQIHNHGLNHFEDCSNREYDDQNCDCGMERLEKLTRDYLEGWSAYRNEFTK